MSAGLDLEFGASLRGSLDNLAVAVTGLCSRMDRDREFIQRANQAYRQVEFGGAITLSSGAGSLQDFNRFGCPQGYYWSVRRLTAQGFTAGSVTAYRDSTAGEPLMPFAVAEVNMIGKGELVLKPMSQIIWSATGITGTVNVWGVADQIESWLFPWYIGAQRDGA